MTDESTNMLYRTLNGTMHRRCKLCGKVTNDLQSYCKHIDHDHLMNAQAKLRYEELDRAKARASMSRLRLK